MEQLVRLSICCHATRAAYFDIQSRLKEVKAKNVDSTRKRRGLLNQLKGAIGLESLSLVNVNLKGQEGEPCDLLRKLSSFHSGFPLAAAAAI